MKKVNCNICNGSGCIGVKQDIELAIECRVCSGLGFLYSFPSMEAGRNYSAGGVADNMDLFQQWATDVWFKGFGDDMAAPLTMERDLPIMALGLVGEGGEVAELIKKHIRDGGIDKEKLRKELGDVFYYLCRIASFYEISAPSFALANIIKCEGRIKRGTRRGSGDDR